jgi:AmmeMemoRadiSam system protein A
MGELTAADRQALLARAREAVVCVVEDSPPAADTSGSLPIGALAEPGAAFVTLHVGGKLRGCIGTSERRRSLWSVVGDMARAAATRDPRFDPIVPEDLETLGIEISILSPARQITDLAEIEIGRHGLDIRRDGTRGLLLPQVATEHDLNREAFLAATCRKAGLAPEIWRDPDTELRVFEAEVVRDR